MCTKMIRLHRSGLKYKSFLTFPLSRNAFFVRSLQEGFVKHRTRYDPNTRMGCPKVLFPSGCLTPKAHTTERCQPFRLHQLFLLQNKSRLYFCFGLMYNIYGSWQVCNVVRNAWWTNMFKGFLRITILLESI